MYKFNWGMFSDMVETVYSRPNFCPLHVEDIEPYTVDDFLSIFEYFFKKYKAVVGKEHPPLKWPQIKDIMERLPHIDFDDKAGWIDVPPEAYPHMIDAYFSTKFVNCNYRINHFMSDNIRIFKFYEAWY